MDIIVLQISRGFGGSAPVMIMTCGEAVPISHPNPRSELSCKARWRLSPCRSKLTYGRRLRSAAPTSRLRAVRAQVDGTILHVGIGSQIRPRFAHLGSPGMISWPAPAIALLFPYRLPQADFITAPSIATPAVTYFHSATSSFRASATIVGLRRPLSLTRSRNQLLSAESG